MHDISLDVTQSLNGNMTRHSIFLQTAIASKSIKLMAAHCFGILSITDVLSEHIDVVEEIRLYATCSAIYSGNKVHRDILKELRDYYYAYNVIPTLQRHHSQGSNEGQETAQAAPPLYRVCLEFRLEDLYDRRPELMPLADDPCWESD